MATQSVRRIIVQVALQGKEVLAAVKQGFSDMNKQVSETNKNLKALSTAMKAYISVTAIKSAVSAITSMADSYSLMVDRIKIFTGSAETAEKVIMQLAEVANSNRTSIEAVGTTYNRLSLALSDTGVSSEQLIAITDVLTKSFRLSGSTAAEATAATIQLSQGLASGQLRGQEMRSVLEQNAIMGEILAKTFGKTRGELMKLAETGFFTSDKVLNALAKNQDAINQKAKSLGVTFDALYQIIKNDLTVSIGGMVKSLNIPEATLKGYEFLKENLIGVSAAIGALTVALSAGAIAKGIQAIVAIGTAFLTVKAALIAIGVGVVAFGAMLIFETEKTTTTLKIVWEKMKQYAYETAVYLLELFTKVTRSDAFLVQIATMNTKISESKAVVRSLNEELEKMTKKEAPEIPTIDPITKNGPKTLKDYNEMLSAHTITIKNYNKALEKLSLEKVNKEFKEGTIDAYRYEESLRRINLDKLGRDLDAGVITLAKFNSEMKNIQLEELDKKFKQGKVSLAEYYAQYNKLTDSFSVSGGLRQGVATYIESIGTLSTGISQVIQGTFSKLEDLMVEFTMNGKANFKKFAYAVIEDLNRIILRAMVIKPLADGVLGAIGGGGVNPGASTGNGTIVAGGYAKGGAFNKGVEMFASGGVVNRTTAFGMANGKLGVMGEAGPEAILPLSRGSDGKLGIEASTPGVQINIINNTGAEVEQSTSEGPNGEQIIDLLIVNKVREGIARGQFDGAMKTSYGLRRQGR